MTIFKFLAVFLFIFAISSCIKEKQQEEKRTIKYLKAYKIPVPEPSGLALTFEEDGFWVVSDEDSTLYNLDKNGDIVKKIKIDGFDLEGVTVVDDSTIAVVLERTREVVLIDTSGKELERASLNLRGEANSGLEGISYNPESQHYYLINEKKPGLLIELNADLETISLDTLNFTKDVSGIFYDEANKYFWILSDENQKILILDMNKNLVDKFDITIVQPEGITLSADNRKLYIVSDNKEKLYVFEIN